MSRIFRDFDCLNLILNSNNFGKFFAHSSFLFIWTKTTFTWLLLVMSPWKSLSAFFLIISQCTICSKKGTSLEIFNKNNWFKVIYFDWKIGSSFKEMKALMVADCLLRYSNPYCDIETCTNTSDYQKGAWIM